MTTRVAEGASPLDARSRVHWSPSLGIGFTSVICRTLGKQTVTGQVLIIEVKGREIAWGQSLGPVYMEVGDPR